MPKVPTKQIHGQQRQTLSPIDKASWRVSIIREGITINKTAAKMQYRLVEDDLQGLGFSEKMTRKPINGMPRPMYLYQEREIEYRAWEKHGGPEAFDALIMTKKEAFYRRHGPDTSTVFHQPRFYARYDATTPELRQMKAELVSGGKGWLWKTLLDCLRWPDNWFSDTNVFSEALKAARNSLVSEYPPRTVANPIMAISPSFVALKTVLSRAPVWMLTKEQKAQFDVSHVDARNCRPHIMWSASYVAEINHALDQVIAAHNLAGWRKARWLIYDKYVECNLGGVRYSAESSRHQWWDHGIMWLHEDRYKGTYSPHHAATTAFIN